MNVKTMAVVGAGQMGAGIAQVAAQGYAALMDGKNKIVAGSLKTKVQGALNDVLPDRVKAVAHRQMAEPKEQPQDL